MSTVRDLGYKPYEGKRLPPSNNSKVLFRHGLRRAWGSWLVKIAAFVGWLPTVVYMAIVGVRYGLANNMDMIEPMNAADAAVQVNELVYVQLWVFVSLVTLGAGAGVLSQDLSQKAFQFYFAKPVTRMQYLLGRFGAVALWCFGLTFFPALLLIGMLTGIVAETARLETLGLVLPALLHTSLLALCCAGGSVGMSSLSRSRAFTMSAWLFLFIVPQVVAVIVASVGDWPWLRLLALPSLIEVVGDGLFKVAREDALKWWHCAPVLLAMGAGGYALAYDRLRRAEVIS